MIILFLSTVFPFLFVGIADQMFIGPEVTYDHPQRSNRVILPVFAGAEGAAGDTTKALSGIAFVLLVGLRYFKLTCIGAVSCLPVKSYCVFLRL